MTDLRTPPVVASPGSPGRALLRLSRPWQWHQALMLFAAPAAAGVLDDPGALLRSLIAAVGFTFLAVAVYAFNDVRDAPDDRRHPQKRLRPVAASAVSPTQAVVWGGAAALTGLGITAALGWATLGLAVTYLVAQVLYVLGLKYVAVVDLIVVALGFVIRAAQHGVLQVAR